MAVQNLVEQHLAFISATESFDTAPIYANSLIQSLAANSVGNDLVVSMQNYAHWDSVNQLWSFSSFLEFRCYVSATFQATIQQNIPNLQAAFPQYTIVTFGYTVQFGN